MTANMGPSAASELRVRLQERLARHDSVLRELVGVVPAKYYLADDDQLQGGSWKKYMQNKKERAPKQLVKENTRRAKRLKLDPEAAHPTVLEVQAQQAQQAAEEVAEEQPARPKANVQLAGSIRELKDRIRSRIEQLRQKRHAPDQVGAASKKKRADDKARPKKKMGATGGGDRDEQQQRVHVRTEGKGGAEGGLVYSKFDFGALEKKKKQAKGSLKQLLVKAETAQAKMDRVKADDSKKGAEVAEKAAQRKALAMAQGIRQADDVSLLKKAIKRKEKAKMKSSKDWKTREKVVEDAVAKRIAQRNANIQARIQGVKDRRMAKGKKEKSKKSRPGFEGKQKPKGKGKPKAK